MKPSSRLLLFLVVLTFPLLAQQTTVTDTIRTGTGALAQGTIYITPSQQFTTSGGIVVYPITTPVAVTNGIFTVRLYPNDATSSPPSTGCPAVCTSYTARYSLTNDAQNITETWLVPTSATPVNLAAVRTSPAPLPSPTVALSQVTSGGGIPGQCPVLSGALIWQPGPCGSGGGGGGAPTNATYLTRQAEPGLSAEFNMGGLASGVLKQTVAAGVSTPAIAIAGTDYVIPAGSITGNAGTASSLDHDPAACPAGQPVSDVSPTIVLTCVALTAAQVTNAFDKSASNSVSVGTQDFSAALHTLPIQKGTVLPVSCTVGELYFKTDATAGQNLYLCTATNTWTQMLGSGGGGGLSSINSDGTAAQTLTQTNDTNVTLAIVNNGSGDHKFNLGFTGTLAAGRLNANVVQSVANDTNITGSIATQTLTLAWAGTLAKARQNGATVYNDQSNVYGAFLQDFNAASLKIPIAAGATTTTNGLIAYDSTNNMLHAAQTGADALIPQFTIAPVNNDCVRWVVAGSNYKLGTAGAACGSGGGGGVGDPGANGIMVRTALNATQAVTITGTAGNIVITNGNGVAGPPTINIGATPALGTPSSLVLTNATGLPISTGVSGLATGMATFLATPTSLNLATTMTDETGTGSLVFATSPNLITPALGTPTAVVLTNATGLPLSTGVTGLLASTNGGTGAALNAAAAHSMIISTGATPAVFSAKVIPDCQDISGNHLNFIQASDTITCGSGGGGGSTTWTTLVNDIYNANTGNVGIGAAPGNYKLDVSRSGSVGTARFYDQTATTGKTSVMVIRGAGQDTAPTDLWAFTNAALQQYSGVDSDGDFFARDYGSGSFKKKISFSGNQSVTNFGGSFDLSSDSLVRLKSVDNLDAAGVYDIGLCRTAAGRFGVNDGSSVCTNYRDLTARNYTSSGMAGSGARCVHADNVGALTIAAADCLQASGYFSGSVATSTTGITVGGTTLSFSLADQSLKSPVRFEAPVLTFNITSVTFTGKTSGAKFSVVWTQNATGGFTVNYAGSASNTCVIAPSPSVTTTQLFEIASDGTTVNGIGCSTNQSGVLSGPESVVPATPAAGTFSLWTDATAHAVQAKVNGSATIQNMVKGIADPGADGNCVKYIGLDATQNRVTCGTGGGGGGSVFTGSTAANSTGITGTTSLTFSLADQSVKSPVRFEPTALSANITVAAFTNKTAGAKFSIAWTQAAVGGPYTVSYGATANNTCTISTTTSITTTQFFEVGADGTTVNGTGCTSNETGVLISGPEMPAVTSTAAGNGALTFDSGAHTAVYYANASANRHAIPRVASGDQIVCADLADSGTGCSGTGGGGGGGGGSTGTAYTISISAQTSFSIPASTHLQGTLPTGWCFDNSTPRVAVNCAYTRSATGDLVFSFSPAFTGMIEVGSGGGVAGIPYTTTVTAQTSVSITAATHTQGTLATPWCFDNSTPRVAVSCSYTRSTSGDLVFSFAPAFTGLIEIGAGTTSVTSSGGGTSFYPVAAMFENQRVIGSVSGALNFSSTIANGACGTQTMTLAGAVPDDTVAQKRPFGVPDGWQMSAWVSGYDTIKVQMCNATGSGGTLIGFSYGVSLIR